MVLESPADSDNLFNLELVRTATVDIVLYSCEGREKGSVDGLVAGKWDGCHEPRYWSAMDRYRVTLLQRKQAQDVSLWFPYRFRAGRTAGNSHGHSLVQSPECGNEFNQAWESCTTTG